MDPEYDVIDQEFFDRLERIEDIARRTETRLCKLATALGVDVVTLRPKPHQSPAARRRARAG